MPQSPPDSHVYGQAILQSCSLRRLARSSRMDQELLPRITQSKGSTGGRVTCYHRENQENKVFDKTIRLEQNYLPFLLTTPTATEVRR